MKASSPKSILVLLAVLVVVVIAIMYVAVISIQASGEKTLALLQEAAANRSQTEDLSKNKGEDLKEMARDINAYFVSKDGVVNFIEDVEKEARTYQLEVFVRSVDVTKNSDDPNDNKEVMKLKLEMRGSWGNTLRFISYLERIPYKVTLENIEMTKISELSEDFESGANLPRWRTRLEMSVLKFK